MALPKTYKVVNETSYDDRTPDDLVTVLERVRQDRTRVRLFYGDLQTGKVWEELPNRGRIGRSMGPVKVPLLLRSHRSLGGEAILDHCILQVRESRYGGNVLWTHPAHIKLQSATTG